MTDYIRDDPAREALRAACWERGIRGAEDFRRVFGFAPAELTAATALVLVTTPEWVTRTWIPHAGRTPVVWVPAAVHAYAAVFGIAQHESESDHDFTLRLQAAAHERRDAA